VITYTGGSTVVLGAGLLATAIASGSSALRMGRGNNQTGARSTSLAQAFTCG
jgi:hypothetical protein